MSNQIYAKVVRYDDEWYGVEIRKFHMQVTAPIEANADELITDLFDHKFIAEQAIEAKGYIQVASWREAYKMEVVRRQTISARQRVNAAR
jgi:hypothetical protein